MNGWYSISYILCIRMDGIVYHIFYIDGWMV